MPSDQIRSAIVAEAQSWLGTPYHHAARVKGAGVDCAQILIAVYEAAANMPPIDPAEYPRDWMLHRSEERFLSYVLTRAKKVASPKPGDVALYKFGRCFAHGAIVVDWPTVIHADSKVGEVVMADGTQGRLAGREVKFYSVETP